MRFLSLVTALFLNIFCLSAQGQDAPRQRGKIAYPIVVTSADDLAKFGLSVIGYEPQWPALTHLCYFPIGPGAIEFLSVSHERLVRYRELGFTLNSLCLGLVSYTRFDPETGARLPSYIAADSETVARSGASHVSTERPLELPKCFYRALIYTDCKLNFDRKTGKPLSEKQRQTFKRLGEAIDEIMQKAMAKHILCAWPYCAERDQFASEDFPAGALLPEFDCDNNLGKGDGYLTDFIAHQMPKHGIAVPKTLSSDGDDAGVSCFDVSINLPAGFGYSVDAPRGELGSAVSGEFFNVVLDRKRQSSQIDVDALASQLEKKYSAHGK